MWVYDRETLAVLNVNHAAVRNYGFSREEFLSLTIKDLRLPEDVPQLLKYIQAHQEASGFVTEVLWRHRKKDGSLIWVESSRAWIRYNGRPAGLVIARDVTDRKRSEDFLAGRNRLLEGVTKNEPLDRTLNALIRLLESQEPAMRVSLFLLDEQGKSLKLGAAPSLPPAYLRQFEGMKAGENIAFGAALAKGEIQVCPEIAADPSWQQYKKPALEHGLHACLSVPVYDSKRNALGVFAVYFGEPRRPDARHLEFLEVAVYLASIAIERRNADLDRHRAEKSLEEKNIALKEMLSQLEIEKREMGRRITANVDRLVGPLLKKLRLRAGKDEKKHIEMIETNLSEIIDSFGVNVAHKFTMLTPKEIEICNMIRNGLSSKEIAGALGTSPLTVETHRNRIRKKLGISNKDINLTSYLKSL